ncbi:hypothetical protein ACFVGY_23295 [Streptomyces sp. NPDC127106]|uniref:effector-associated constant component EACC1 n=1 Tax=Streptomyces sp. NPDC127106 TaxID=3345360 RepID=UPI00362B2695
MSSLQIFLFEEEVAAEHLARMAGALRQDLLQLEVDDVTTVSRADPPDGARGVVAEVGALLVALGPSATLLREVVGAVMDWRQRSRSRPTIRLELDGDVLEISEASADHLEAAVRVFVNRHSAREAAS